MQQGRQQLRLHALAEGELAHRPRQLLPQFEHVRQFGDAAPGGGVIEAIDGRIHPQGIERRQIPDQLLLLAHHQGDLTQEVGLAALGDVACHLGAAATGMDQATEHLQGGGLAGAVGAEEAHHLAGLNRETHRLHGRHIAMAPLHEMAQGAGQARLLVGHPVGLGKRFGPDDRHRAILS